MTDLAMYRKVYRLKRHRGIPTSLVPATKARNHLKKLTDIGWSYYALEDITGITDQGLRFIADRVHTSIERRTHHAIMSVPYTYAVHDRIADERFVPSEGAVRRIHALMAIGWTRDTLAPHTGDTSVYHLSRNPYGRMEAARWRDVDHAYQLLHMAPGPSKLARQRAEAKGYAPPLAYEDIDAPNARPTATRNPDRADPVVVNRILNGDWRLHANPAERLEVIRLYTGSLAELGRRTGWNVHRELKRVAS